MTTTNPGAHVARQTRPASWTDEEWCDEHGDRIVDEIAEGLRDERGRWIGDDAP